MSRTGTLTALAVVAVLVWRLPLPSAGHDDKKEMAALHRPDGLKWQDGPPSLPPGAKIAVLEGDPAKPGPFVFRVKGNWPASALVSPHISMPTSRSFDSCG